ncbi:hypothetical protein [Calidithermus timidus]|jgi:hypothetical protein|uniref:hypothetical protein n=1 Tax=Calidithermus timidus TaxID=307124 RepID=UPI0003645482|nr:hypothetical protein [Calidithermus timidus]
MNFTFLNLVGYALLAVAAFLLWRGSASLSARLMSLGLLGLILWGMLGGNGAAKDSRFRGYREDAFGLSSLAECAGGSSGGHGGGGGVYVDGGRPEHNAFLCSLPEVDHA